jgi:hypothetical protein
MRNNLSSVLKGPRRKYEEMLDLVTRYMQELKNIPSIEGKHQARKNQTGGSEGRICGESVMGRQQLKLDMRRIGASITDSDGVGLSGWIREASCRDEDTASRGSSHLARVTMGWVKRRKRRLKWCLTRSKALLKSQNLVQAWQLPATCTMK